MNLNDVLFIESYPSIDLHGFDSNYAKVKVNEFINDNYKMGNYIIVIIHGIGNGILKREVQKELKLNSKVADYRLFYNNIGCTIVKLKR